MDELLLKKAIQLKNQRRKNVRNWKELYSMWDNELDSVHLKQLDTNEALEDAIDEMSREEIVLLIRRLVRAAIP